MQAGRSIFGCTESRAGWHRQVIGYSDGRDFAVGVGPSPAASQAEGRFADLVQQVIIRKVPEPAQREKHPGAAAPASPTAEAATSREAIPDLPKKARPLSPRSKARLAADALRLYGARHGTLYDTPPAAQEKSEEKINIGPRPGLELPTSGGLSALYDFLPPAREKKTDFALKSPPGIEVVTQSNVHTTGLATPNERGAAFGSSTPSTAGKVGATKVDEHGKKPPDESHQKVGGAAPRVPVEVDDDMFAESKGGPP